MPVLRFKPGRVEEVLGLPLREALEVVERLKVEAEVAEDGYVEFEIEVDRPDMYILEGIARQAAGILGREKGLPRFEVVKSGYRIIVSSVDTRPYIAGAVVWNVNVDEDYLEELIQFQEKLHGSMGSGRERVAIGLHDLDKLPSKTLYYRMERIGDVRFRPLGGVKEMSLAEVLSETEQGRKYGGLSLSGDRHPVLYSGDQVISVPPVINAELTRIEPGTKHVFIDVTGTSLKAVLDTLAVIVAGLSERGGRRIGLVHVEAPWGTLKEPRMEPSKMVLDIEYASRHLGIGFGAGEAAEHLERMRFGATPAGDAAVEALIPRYRVDILHPVDLVEEIMLSIGVDNMPARRPRLMLRGRLLLHRYWERQARLLLAGHGFVEVLGYTLVPCSHGAEAGIDREKLVAIENPVGEESGCLRASLLPQLLRLAAANQHRVPLRVFEVGEAYIAAGSGDTGVEARKRLAILIMDRKAGYEDIQAVVYSLLRLLGDEVLRVERSEHPLLIPGRTARIETREGLEAVLGEARPEKLEELGVTYPVAVAEIDYTGLAGGAGPVPRP